MFIQQLLPRFLVFLGGCISSAVVDLGGVFEVDSVKDVFGDVKGVIREPEWKMVSILELHLRVLCLEHLLECY
jgi:hypothetical protein